MGHTLTEEQEAMRKAFATGENMVAEAYAGAAKTTTCVVLAADVPDDKLVYIAYNRSIANEAQGKFGRNVLAKTAHSFAWKAIVGGNRNYQHRLDGPRMTAKDHASILGIKSGIEFSDDRYLSQYALARIVADTVRNFTYSADEEVQRKHVEFVKGVDMNALSEYILPFARKMWKDKANPRGICKFVHDDYLKLWALSHPRIAGDAAFLDEAQDSNPCVAGIFEDQRHMQRVMVGDRYQQIYGWRGAVDAMQSFDAKIRLTLTQSFRFGPAIATEANKWLYLLGAEKPLVGFDQIDSTVVDNMTDADAVLCRTNATVVANAMAAMEAKKRFAIVGGTQEIMRFAEAAEQLMGGRRTNHPDLTAFKNWEDVQKYVTEEGTDLKTLVTMIDSHGVEKVKEIAATSVDERYADIILSTAHKAKGREWDKVRIAEDFTEPEATPENPDPQPSKADMMLAYVSVTRAKRELDVGGLQWINRWIARREAENASVERQPSSADTTAVNEQFKPHEGGSS